MARHREWYLAWMKLVGRLLAVVSMAAIFAIPAAVSGDATSAPALTAATTLDTPVFVKQFGSAGSGDGQLSDPWQVAVDGADRWYVADAGNHRIQVFSRYGGFLAAFGTQGSGDGHLESPRGVAVTPAGTIVVADTGNDRIQLFEPDGTFVSAFGGPGPGDGQFDAPSGLSVRSDGSIIVADTDNHRVQLFTAAGTYLATFGEFGAGDGQLNAPVGVAVDSNGRIHVVEQLGERVTVFEADGSFVTHLGGPGSGDDELSQPSAISIDDHDVVHVLDTGNSRIQGFDGSDYYEFGMHRWSFAEVGITDSPRGLSVDDRGRLLITDGAGHVEVWRYLKCGGLRGTVVGTEGPDGLSADKSGDFGGDVIIGRGGDDGLFGNVGGDTMCGGPGNDVFYGEWGNDWIRGDAGDDYIVGGPRGDTIRGNKGNDTIIGLKHRDVIFGNEGDDTIESGEGPDRIHAGPGDDLVNGGEGDDRINGGPDHDVCDGGDRGAAQDVIAGCEEIVESPAPDGWYRMGVFAFRGSGPLFEHEADIDEETGYIWGAADTPRKVAARDHNGDVVIEHFVGGRPSDVQVHDGEIYHLDWNVDKIFVLSTDGEPRREWSVPEVCDIEVTATHVLAGVGGDEIQLFDHEGNLESTIPLEVSTHCEFSLRSGRIYDIVFDDPDWYVGVFDLDGNLVGEIARQPERIWTLDVARNGGVWIAGREFGGWIRGFTAAGTAIASIEGFEPQNSSIYSIVADNHAVWLSFSFTFQHSHARRVDVFTNLSCDGKSLTHVGTSYDDVLQTGSAFDVVHMGNGNDELLAGGGDDTMCGGRGDDVLDAGEGDDDVFGGNDDDALNGGPGDDICRGGAGSDVAEGCESELGLDDLELRYVPLAPGWPSTAGW